jgi:hypothetical protein
MLSSKMSADEEEAVMKELAKLQAELVSRSIRWFLVFTTIFLFRSLLQAPSICQRLQFRNPSPDQRVSFFSWVNDRHADTR